MAEAEHVVIPLVVIRHEGSRSVEIGSGNARIKRVTLNYVALFGNAHRASVRE